MTTARRRRVWQDFRVAETTPDGAVDALDLVKESTAGEVKGMTLVRMVISLTVMGDALSSTSTILMNIALGVGLVSFEAGISLIDPANQDETPSSGWMWRYLGTISDNLNQPLLRLDYDIRAQRKLMYAEPRLFIANNVNSGAGFVIETFGIIRCLYLLP